MSETAATITPITRKRPSTAARKSAANAAPKTAAAPKRTAAKSATPKPTAAKPVKATPPKPAGPTVTEQKRITANALVKTAADMLDRWNPKQHQGVTREFAAQVVASWLNYTSVSEWDPRLPDRSGAGGRGARARKTA
jgi:hypothetical protein